MKKLLYAINHEKTENAITKKLDSEDFVIVGTVPHRETLLKSIESSAADVLLYRESLKGSTDTFELMKQIRTNFPTVRIVFIANTQSISSKLLARLVFLGIYDIINNDALPLDELVGYIVSPRNFGHAEKYFRADYMEEMVPDFPENTNSGKGKKTNLLEALLSRKADGSLPLENGTVNFETMRGAMLEEARRIAQAELPKLVEIQVNEATAALRDDQAKKEELITKLSNDVKNKAQSEAVLKQQLKEAVQLRKNAEDQLFTYRSEAEQAMSRYQEQLESLLVTQAPEWYQEQAKKWENERSEYQSKLDKQLEQIKGLTAKLGNNENPVPISVPTSVNSDSSALVAARTQIRILTEELAAYKAGNSIGTSDSILRAQIETLEMELEDARKQLKNSILIPSRTVMPHEPGTLPEVGFDTDPESKRPKFMPHISNNYRRSTGEGRMLAFVGAKHGLGNTTVALNTAINLANSGYKTLFVEINRNFPLVTELFEFSNVESGLDTVLNSLAQNKMPLAAQYIIKPHELAVTQKNMSKVYKTLPSGLHFLLYSNEFLHKCKLGTAPVLTEEDFKALSYFLLTQEQYSYVIFDVQADDLSTINVLLNSGCHVNQLMVTVNQDTHSITTAGYLAEMLKQGKNPSLIANAKFIVNQYSSANKLTIKKMSDFLSIPESSFIRLSLDNKGYINANFTAIPYVLAKEKYSKEYEQIQIAMGA